MRANEEKRKTASVLKPGVRNRIYRLLSRNNWRLWFPKDLNKLIRSIVLGSKRGEIYQCSYREIKNILVPNDSYWAGYISNLTSYEPEIGSLLRDIMGEETAFIDCGANIGLWSCVASYFNHCPDQVFAVEAGSQVMYTLSKNSQNKGFVIIPKVIHSEASPSIPFYEYGDRHSHNSLFFDTEYIGTIPRMVESTTLDMIVEVNVNQPNLIIKLDIEGSEKSALVGAKNLLNRRQNVLFIYEDHGKDPTSDITMFLLNELRLNVHFIDYKQGLKCISISSLEEVQIYKTNKRKGYNFVATIPGTPFDYNMKSLSNHQKI